MFKKIGIYVKDKAYEGIDHKALDSLIENLLHFPVNIFIENSSDYSHSKIKALPDDDFVASIELLIVFGGDGTLLGSARKFLKHNVGFLTDIKIDSFESTLNEILSGDFVIEERSLVSANFLDQTVYGLNEIVIHSGAYAQLMRYRLNVNGKVVYEQRSDGLIIATPTGSTAYALSAGGPIIHPALDVWTILPMLPQSISSRPFVISSNEDVSIEILRGPLDKAKICADGQDDTKVPFSEKIKISKMDNTLKLVHPKKNDFFEACREKLGWSLDISNTT
jgi:NAD+ kinase